LVLGQEDVLLFFFSSRRRHTRFKCDWSSDVCSSDLAPMPQKNDSPPALVGIIMGSKSDWETMRHAAEKLDELKVPYEKRVVSARSEERRVGKEGGGRGAACHIT